MRKFPAKRALADRRQSAMPKLARVRQKKGADLEACPTYYILYSFVETTPRPYARDADDARHGRGGRLCRDAHLCRGGHHARDAACAPARPNPRV